MGLFQQAVKTYDAQKKMVGKFEEGHPAVLAPIGHITARLDIIVTIDDCGNFIRARSVAKDEKKAPIPATTESMGRTSGISAHPLCDRLEYLATYDKRKHQAYENCLGKWISSEFCHPKIVAVMKYIKKDTILQDLENASLVELRDGKPEKPKLMIGWEIEGLADVDAPCWTDLDLMRLYGNFYSQSLEGTKEVCMISGKETAPAQNHLKGIVSNYGNAKLISSNDTSNFTYRGRFNTAREALSIGYVSSQKAHNVLKWLIEEQGVYVGGRYFLCWNPDGKKIPSLRLPFLMKKEDEIIVPSDYKDRLYGSLTGYKAEGGLTGNEIVVIVAFDMATTGRLSVTYYNEISASDFLEKIRYWEDGCCVYDSRFGVLSPDIKRIIRCAFGIEHSGKLDVDDRVLKQFYIRMLLSRIEGRPIPKDILFAIVKNASRPSSYETQWNKVLQVACAVIRKYHIDYNLDKEEMDMALEAGRKDRSYQYGRLLAVFRKIEEDALRSQGGNVRETNAERLWSAFVNHPRRTSAVIMEKLRSAYFPRLGYGGLKVKYEKLVGEIMEQIDLCEEKPGVDPALKDTYLMGYYLQNNALYEKHEEKEREV